MIHSTAEVSPQAIIGPGTMVWARSHVREGARLGKNCIVGEGVYIDADVRIGDNVKIQNGALLYRRLTVADGAFIGPQACFTNDLHPRAVTPAGTLKTNQDWTPGESRVDVGASVGAAAVVLPGIHIGQWAMVGAGAVVTRDVPDHALVLGAPARQVGWVCACGERLVAVDSKNQQNRTWRCPKDGWERVEAP
jgi:UDP-2-acetamido-3-amino-2,3-dideoxy-glucuronate N-acetyltransferase